MEKVKCDNCGQIIVLTKPKHKWLDKENGIALKYHQCKICKATFPERIQTEQQLKDVRELQAMRARIKQTPIKIPANADADTRRKFDDAMEETTTAAELFQLMILQEQERLRRQHGEGLGFFLRQCPKCGLDVVDMQVARHLFGEIEDEGGEKKEIYRARLLCVCGWVGRWPELKTVQG